ncbi:DUF397 domain-containing protein [Streptomyces sp. NPDC001985]|uniref:DUF397 domain-containing protein n=1 Tax=Streptomyces sp. NPDC001985 TaxID=3154406 RepID=UPI003331F4E6
MTLIWRKSSYSGGGGGNCVEVAAWFKSSHSDGGGGDCVEISVRTEAVLVRDSKDTERTPLTVSPSAWADFTTLAAGSRL